MPPKGGCRITTAAYTLVHLCNVLINRHMTLLGSDIRVNYMYSIQPENPALVYAPELRRALATRHRAHRLTPRI